MTPSTRAARPLNRAERVYTFLSEREGCWIEATRFERISRCRCSWRTALSQARRTLARPAGFDIVNRLRYIKSGKRRWTLSEYALVRLAKRKAA